MNRTEKKVRYETLAMLKRKEQGGTKKMTLRQIERAAVKGQRGPNKVS